MISKKEWYVYILRCSDKYLYTGISVDVAHRVRAHREGKGARFTKGKEPIELVYVAKQKSHQDALIVERTIKRYSREKKEKLIATFTTELPTMNDTVIKSFLSVNKQV